MAQKHQKGIIAALLASPSTLNKHFKAGDQPAIDAELDRLGFSAAAKEEAKQAMQKINSRGKTALFAETASILQEDIWRGVEPHPNNNEAQELVAKARALDGE